MICRLAVLTVQVGVFILTSVRVCLLLFVIRGFFVRTLLQVSENTPYVKIK